MYDYHEIIIVTFMDIHQRKRNTHPILNSMALTTFSMKKNEMKLALIFQNDYQTLTV
jgi:hypothetical protein